MFSWNSYQFLPGLTNLGSGMLFSKKPETENLQKVLKMFNIYTKILWFFFWTPLFIFQIVRCCVTCWNSKKSDCPYALPFCKNFTSSNFCKKKAILMKKATIREFITFCLLVQFWNGWKIDKTIRKTLIPWHFWNYLVLVILDIKIVLKFTEIKITTVFWTSKW